MFAAFEDEKGVYLVMELAHGGDLFQWVKKHREEKEDEEGIEQRIVQNFMVPFLNALKYLHSRVS